MILVYMGIIPGYCTQVIYVCCQDNSSSYTLPINRYKTQFKDFQYINSAFGGHLQINALGFDTNN